LSKSLTIALAIIVAGIVSVYTGFSTAVLELMAGAAARNLLGLQPNIPWLTFLANLGLLGLMFYAGFEVEVPMLKRNFLRASVLAGLAYFVPLLVTFSACRWMLHYDVAVSFLVGIALSTTSVALVYSVLDTRKWTGKPSGQLMLGGAMLIDTFSLLSLALLFGGLDWYTLIELGVIAVLLMLVRRFGARLFRRCGGRLEEMEMRFLLLVLVGIAFLAEQVQIHGAILAFVLGLLMSELRQRHPGATEKFRPVIFGFLAPLFFFQAGLLMELRELSWSSLWVLLLLGIVAFGSKFGAAVWGFRGFSLRRAFVCGWVFNLRLTFGIIAAVFGLESGLLNSSLYSVILGIVLLTSIFSSFAIRGFTLHEL